MIPDNIDLTANRDFGAGRLADAWFDVPFEPDDFFAGHENEVMTTDKYEELLEKERFFGKNVHPNRKWDVFKRQEDNEAFNERRKCHCFRCGAQVKIPWRIYEGLCEKCENEMMGEDSFSFPMARKDVFHLGEMEGIRPNDLFHMT